jgi:tRNA pseudouridine55 synthase
MNGIINFIKPPGITSNDAVVDFKRLLGIKKVGHAGTLDPAAAGVLPITIGRGTRLFNYLLGSDKVYVGEILLGFSTDTFDTCGTVLNRSLVTASKDSILEKMSALTGEILQTPPMYSAIKHGGRKLYQLARKGEKAEVAPRPVTIFAFELLDIYVHWRMTWVLRWVAAHACRCWCVPETAAFPSRMRSRCRKYVLHAKTANCTAILLRRTHR